MKEPKSGTAPTRVLISAYACGPVEEPEAAAGWEFAKAAARDHEVWVFTRQRFEPAIRAALAADPDLAARLHVIHLDLGPRAQARLRHSWDVYWYYACWQVLLARRARALHREVGFHVGHHVTFANDWLPCGLNRLRNLPLVWGPVGGASRVPLRHLARWLGPRGTATELVRGVATGVPRLLWGDPVARRAAVVVAQNQDVAQRFRRARRVLVEPNAAFDVLAPQPMAGPDAPAGRETAGPVAVFAGRLLAWKGCRLAVAALARPELDGWRLQIFGVGPQRAALDRMIDRLGLAGRVEFLGRRPRAEVLRAFADAAVMLFPSMHDQAGWVAGEASALGCPVVCLPLGGPPVMAGPNAHVVPIDRHVVRSLAQAVAAAGLERGPRYDRWTADRLPDLVSTWYRWAVEEDASQHRQVS